MTQNDTFPYTLSGREISFLNPDPKRLMLLQRVLRQTQSQLKGAQDRDDAELAQMLMRDMNDMIWTALESQFTDPADLMFVQTEILARRIQEEDLYPILNGGKTVVEVQDDADPPAAKPRKKAAPKAAPKAAAKRNNRGVR